MAMINAQSREGVGKGVARKLRREGRVPAVLYGGGRDNRNLSVDIREWMALVEQEGTSLRTNSQNLVVDAESRVAVLLRGFQIHPVTGGPVHVDFMRFDPNQKVEVAVPVKVVDEEKSPGIKEGGILQMVRRELDVRCRAGDIPNFFEISIEKMGIGDSIHIDDIEMPEGVEVPREVNFTILAVVGVKAEELEEGAVAEEEGDTPVVEVTGEP